MPSRRWEKESFIHELWSAVAYHRFPIRPIPRQAIPSRFERRGQALALQISPSLAIKPFPGASMMHERRNRYVEKCGLAALAIILLAAAGVCPAAESPKTELLWPNGAPGAKGERPARQADAHRLPARPEHCQRRRGGHLPGRRLCRFGRRSRRPAGRRLAEFHRRGGIHSRISASRPRLSTPGAVGRRPAGHPHGPRPGGRVEGRSQADRHPRLFRGRTPGIHRRNAF